MCQSESQKSYEGAYFIFTVVAGVWGVLLFFIYDLLSRRTADRLDAVVISTNYRLAPKYHFPIQFKDVYNALRWFLCQDVLEKYGVDPERIDVSGDSAGGNLATAVTQQPHDAGHRILDEKSGGMDFWNCNNLEL
ncbi:arylacetamide deacetylase-like [Choloepus didactylus]|uniref:arylacetamide deacetylase-like n=1 Tax=Choloepus didactylus TaxID=27675 RepID=UPI00189F6D94|nr:arylacetamide deacetylase-like [Choloepus didactylus]